MRLAFHSTRPAHTIIRGMVHVRSTATYALLAMLAVLSPHGAHTFVGWLPHALRHSRLAQFPFGRGRGNALRPPSLCSVVAKLSDAQLLSQYRANTASWGFGKLCSKCKRVPLRHAQKSDEGWSTIARLMTDASSPIAVEEEDDENVPFLRNEIKKMARRAEMRTSELHPAEMAATSRVDHRVPRTMSRSGDPSRRTQTDWYRAKTDEQAILHHPDNTLPFRAGQLVYCANDNGRLLRGTLLSLERAKNRLLVGRVSLHSNAQTGRQTDRQTGTTRPGQQQEGKIKFFRLAALFPIGGCNGGLESELERLVSFHVQYDLRGAANLLMLKRALESSGDTGSTLSLLTAGRAPAVDLMLEYLEEVKLRLMHRPFGEHSLVFSSYELGAAREGLKNALVDAETRLLRFCEVLADTLFRVPGAAAAEFARSTGVACEIRLKGSQREHFTIEEPLTDEQLASLMSGEGFGKKGICDHLVSNMRVLPHNSFRHAWSERKKRKAAQKTSSTGGGDILDYLGSLNNAHELAPSLHFDGWCDPKELSHYLVYEAQSPAHVDASGGVLRFFGSRKSATELLDIVADKLCHVDAYVGSSASRGYSDCRQIHNALSVRVVVESTQQALEMLERLQTMRFSRQSLLDSDVPHITSGPPGHCTDRLQVLEVQNRLEGGLQQERPGSTTLMRQEEASAGWRGLIVMVKWWGAPIMIVMEPLEVFHLQQELSTSMSYGQYKERQRKARKTVERRWPVYQLTRSLTHWALADKEGLGPCDAPEVPPALSRIKIKVAA